MALKDLITDLSNFKYTDYGSAGSIESQVGGRHGTVDAPIDNSDFDNGVGFGVDPNSSPQSFNVRGYTISGDKRFIVNYGGDIVGSEGSIYGMGEFNSILTPFDHTQMRDTTRSVYNQYSSVSFGDSRHTSDGDIIGAIGGGVSYYGNLLPITPRASLYGDDIGGFRVPLQGGNTNPPGTESNIVGFDGIQTTLNIPQIVLTGPFDDSYQSNLNTEPIVPNAHGSDFFSPLTNYTSQFSIGDLRTDIESGFSRSDMYTVPEGASLAEPSEIIFKQFTRGDSSLKRVTMTSPNFSPFVFGTGIPYVIPQHTSTGPTEFTIGAFSNDPLIEDLHGSDFMTRPSYTSQIGTDTATHTVSMITLTGPTTDTYQTTINLDRVAAGAHGSDFQTTPLEAFSSRFANDDGFLMDSVFDSGFGTDSFYVGDSRGPTSFGDFKVFKKSDTSLKTIDFGDDMKVYQNDNGNGFTFEDTDPLEFDFKDRLPYNLDDDDQYHKRAPFIIKDIGDKWGPNIDSSLDEGLVRGGIVTSMARSIADALRLTKFIFTGKGILFGLKQAGFQLLNPRAETRLWNPLSLGSGNTIALGIPLRIDRHLGGGTYLDAIGGSDGEDSILTGYGNAVTSTPALQGGKIAFQTARRVTLAHIAAMVPGAGGKVSLGALPEISFDLTAGGSGNITSFSPNTFSDTNDIGFNIPDRNIYARDKKYHINTGPTSIETLAQLNPSTPGNSLVARVTGQDIGEVESVGSPLLDEIIKGKQVLAEGLEGVYPGTGNVLDEPKIHGAGGLQGIARRNGGYSITLGNSNGQVSVNGIPAGNLYDEGEETFPYQQNHRKRSLIPIGLTAGGYGQGPKYGLAARATQESIFDAYNGEVEAFGIEGEFGNIPESRLAVLKDGVYEGDYHGPESSEEVFPYFSGRDAFQSFPSMARTNARLTDGGEFIGVQIGRSGIYDSTDYFKTYYHEFPGSSPVISIVSSTESSLSDRDIIKPQHTIATDLSPNANEVLYYGINTLMRAGSRKYEDEVGRDKEGYINIGLDSPSIRKNNINQSNQAHMVAATTGLTNAIWDPELVASGEIDPNNPPTTGIYKLGNNIHQPRQGEDRTVKGIPPRNTDSADGPVQKPYKVGNDTDSQTFPRKEPEGPTYSEVKRNRDNPNAKGSHFSLSNKEKGDPQVQITQTWIDKNRYPYDYTKPIKLQEFPLRNKDKNPDGTNSGPEMQALSFLSPERGDVGNLYGLPTREKFGNLGDRYQDLMQKDDFPNKIVIKQSKDNPNELILPRIASNSDEPELKIVAGGSDTKKVFETEKTNKFKDNPLIKGAGDDLSQKNTISGNAINRYKTLAYGDLPSTSEGAEGTLANRYDKRVQASTQDNPNQPINPVLDRSTPESPIRFENRDGVGFIKIYNDEIKGDLRDKFDKINMTQYGEDAHDDYIKFKFFDEVNQKHIIFPATLKGLNDTFSPDYASERYVGRPDQVWVYQGTNREISFDFSVAAMSRQQLLVVWEKINYLTGLTYPNWVTQGNTSRMQAPFISLTIGDMYNRMPGYLNGLTYDIEDNATWDTEEGYQLPKIVNINCTFTHIGKHPLANRGIHFDIPWSKGIERNNGNPGTSAYKLSKRSSDNKDLSYILGDK